tara:strand:+ start:514 stop:681 length:168 start_codon:yes stop_codon:yes gene_type:complete
VKDSGNSQRLTQDVDAIFTLETVIVRDVTEFCEESGGSVIPLGHTQKKLFVTSIE